jgi:hypothetical protein
MWLAWSISWRSWPPWQLLLLAWYLPMYPLAGSLTCEEVEDLHGEMLRTPPFSEAPTPYLLHTALTTKRPPVRVSQKVVAQWWRIHRPSAEQQVRNAQDFDTRYGEHARALQPFPSSAYRLCAALRARDPPIFVSDGILLILFNTCEGVSVMKRLSYRQMMFVCVFIGFMVLGPDIPK